MNKAVIMAGGFGTRLRPLTMQIPKPMVKIKNIPMMEHIVNLLKTHDITDIVSVLYFQPEVITNYFQDGADYGVDMTYVMAQADYGTAGAVRNAAEHIKERIIIISGDVLTDFDLGKAIQFHEEKGAKATILLTRVKKPLQFGIVMTDQEGRIERFLEKPSWGQVFSDTINTGIYILEPEVLDMIPFQEEFDFSNDLFPLMLQRKMPLYGYIADGYWRDVGNLDEYQQGQLDSIKEKVGLEYKGTLKDNVIIGKDSRLSPTAKISGKVVIGNNSEVGDHAELHNTTIGDNCIVGMGVKMRGVTLWDNVTIGDFSELNDDVICSGCQIGRSVIVGENVFIADECNLGDDSRLLANIKLWPNKKVESGAILTRSLVQEERWNKELFTDARISGLSNIEINPEFGAKLGASMGMTFGPNAKILVSRDPDRVSRIMKRTIAAGLASVGCNVNDLQIISIPQSRQEMMTGKYTAGFHVRRSPRYPNNTDIIIFNQEGRDISIAKTKKIERYFLGEDIKHVDYDDVGKIYYPERANEIYINRFLDSLDIGLIRDNNYKVLMDYSYGLASTICPFLLGKVNIEALSLHDYVDATKYKPDPTMEKSGSDEAETIMRALGYQLGFIMEPGAEKISLIDERGFLYHPMRLLTLVTKLFLETNKHREPYKIGISVVASNEIEMIAKDYDVEVVRVKNTHSAMMEATRDEDVLFVGGIWGGFIFRDFLFASDGIYSVGKILEMLSDTGITISQLDEELPRRYQYTTEVECNQEFIGKIMRNSMEYSAKMDRLLIDGVKILCDNNSVLLMPHKENSVFQIISESDTFDVAVTLNKKYAALVKQWRDDS